jgi:hypothetical protein
MSPKSFRSAEWAGQELLSIVHSLYAVRASFAWDAEGKLAYARLVHSNQADAVFSEVERIARRQGLAGFPQIAVLSSLLCTPSDRNSSRSSTTCS